MEAIILAGGLGTRLQGVIGAYPKCMAPVNDQPFLSYLFDYLAQQRCTRVILSLGYKHRVITDWVEEQDTLFEVDCVIEEEPLGTGGGILASMEVAETDDVAIVNGDTMFKVDLAKQMAFHRSKNAETTLALKKMKEFDRYGIVNADASGVITSFEEKQYRDEGMINGGVYFINREKFLARKLPDKFSFEKDYLEKFVKEKKFFGYESDRYFIDIGIPTDYDLAQKDFKTLFK
ncbi:MAG: nucleotidyltransferase [Flavipsychrobacter sp.]|jgi:D-glycero-alpha-D-manno-heptose 1-phosphate guanylyltransferase|nr:nucleotidyltransferase [Flavipsychrobacter sp.]